MDKWLAQIGLKGRALSSAIQACEENFVDDLGLLRGLVGDREQFNLTFPQSTIRSAILKALASDGTSQVEEKAIKQTDAKRDDAAGGNNQDELRMRTPPDVKQNPLALPAGFNYHYFLSHKKAHTKFGDASEQLAIRCKDVLKWKHNLIGWFDADNLKRITLEKLSDGIAESACVLLFLNDETLSSTWCVHEVKTARKLNLRIICVVDADRQPVRPVVDAYMAQDYGWLFEDQVIHYSSAHREQSYEQVAEAIFSAVSSCMSITRKIEEPQPQNSATKTHKRVPALHGTRPLEQLKAAIAAKPKELFGKFNTDGIIGRKEWKKILQQILPTLPSVEAKQLRKSLPKKLDKQAFIKFATLHVTHGEEGADSNCELAKLPIEVPLLPSTFRAREFAQNQALLATGGTRDTSVTTDTSSHVSSYGMGGVGKTMLTAAVVRDERLREAFSVVCWINMSQSPDVGRLQRRLYQQLQENDNMPNSKRESIEQQTEALVKAAESKSALIVLDDIWDAMYLRFFDVIDRRTNSKICCSTRIKDLLGSSGKEIALELLGLKESVALLATCAGLDIDVVPPQCLECATLCAGLPLCLAIVGRLIQSYGQDSSWAEEVPNLIKQDMRSLNDKDSASGEMNLQQRVIQSGLDSLTGPDAESIVLLFKGMAVFPEDQITTPPVISVLWTSLGIAKGKISALKLRQWLADLLSKSVILGSVGEGIFLHDIVRGEWPVFTIFTANKRLLSLSADFCLASFTPQQLSKLQRAFTETAVGEYTAEANTPSKYSKAVLRYVSTSLSYHIRQYISQPYHADDFTVRLLTHSSTVIVDQAVGGAEIKGVSKFAGMLKDSDSFESAKLYTALAFRTKAVPMGDKLEFMRSALSALDLVDVEHVNKSEEFATLRTTHIFRLMRLSTDKAESADMCNLLIKWARSGQTNTKLIISAGFVLMGVYPNSYCLKSDTAMLCEGSQLLMTAALKYARMLDLHDDSFAKLKLSSVARNPYEINTGASVIVEWATFADEILGCAGERVVQAASLYMQNVSQNHNLFMAGSQCDFQHELGCGFGPLLRKFANVKMASDAFQMWLEIHEEVKTIADYHPYQVVFVWPCIHFVAGALDSVLENDGVSWRTADAWIAQHPRSPTLSWTYDDETGSVWSFELKTMSAFVDALCAALLPHRTTAAEVADWMPPADCRAVQDRMANVSGWQDCLSAILGLAAENLGTTSGGLQYLNYWFQCRPAKIKNPSAHIRAGSLQRKIQK